MKGLSLGRLHHGEKPLPPALDCRVELSFGHRRAAIAPSRISRRRNSSIGPHGTAAGVTLRDISCTSVTMGGVRALENPGRPAAAAAGARLGSMLARRQPLVHRCYAPCAERGAAVADLRRLTARSGRCYPRRCRVWRRARSGRRRVAFPGRGEVGERRHEFAPGLLVQVRGSARRRWIEALHHPALSREDDGVAAFVIAERDDVLAEAVADAREERLEMAVRGARCAG